VNDKTDLNVNLLAASIDNKHLATVNPHVVLLFWRTFISLAVKKPPRRFNRKSTCMLFQGQTSVFDDRDIQKCYQAISSTKVNRK